MSLIGLATGGVDLSELKTAIGGTLTAPVTLNYDLFIQTVVDSLIMAFCALLPVKGVHGRKRPEPVPERP